MKLCLSCGKEYQSALVKCPACGISPLMVDGFMAYAPDMAEKGGGFLSEYFSNLALLESQNFWFRARNKLILWAIRTYKANAQTFLEVGCGTGFVLSGIAGEQPDIELSGSEIFVAGLSYAAERIPSAQFMQMDARHVPFVNEFDAIGAFDVLEHIEEDEAVLAQLHRAMKPGGVLFLTVPQHPWLWSASDEYACHVRRYTCHEIESKIAKSGYEILRSTSFVTNLLPAMLLSRTLQNRKSETFDPAGELKINAALNQFFYGLIVLDLVGIKLGLNFPVGGSRLIVARKKKV